MKKIMQSCKVRVPLLQAVDVDLVYTTFQASSKADATRQQSITLLSSVASSFGSQSREYQVLGARLLLLDLYERTAASFSTYVEEMHGIVTPQLSNLVRKHKSTLDAAIDAQQDNNFDMIGLKTLLRSYLLKKNGIVRERPQYLYMRVALGMHGNCVEDALKSYRLMSQRYMSHATPTMFNAGVGQQQLASCFLLTMREDSIQGIYDTITQCAKISKHAGGIGLNISSIRASGSHIAGTQGTSNGLVPMLRVFNATAAYVDQGGGRRKGGFAMYLEPWHPDIEAFLDLKKNTGVESARARDLFYALWVPDLFMQRVRADKNWSLICPTQCPALATTCGEAWERLYLDCEKRGVASKTVSARKLWLHFMDTQLETGMPYLMFKDTVNAKSNQKNLGTIRGSNLCSEVTEFTSPDEVAVCTLASLALPQFVEDGVFNYRKLEEVVAHTVKSLDRVIDVTFYPVPEARVSNMRHRPIGIGANGFHDVLFKLEQPWESAEAQQTNKNIFETIYWAAMRASIDLAKELGHYESFPGSPLSEGQFQFDLWGQKATDRYDWESLREEVQTHGARHSLLIALMPTASSAQIIGNTEGVDALTSNLYVRRVSAGEYVVMNKYLEGDLRSRGLWSEEARELLVAHKGSVQKLPIPDDMKKLYKCAFEVTHKSVLDMAIGRGPFVCQSQSMNLHIPNTTQGKLTSSHFYAFDNGLKTASYYVRTKSKVEAVAVTVRKELLETKEVECEMCSA